MDAHVLPYSLQSLYSDHVGDCETSVVHEVWGGCDVHPIWVWLLTSYALSHNLSFC